MEITSRKQKQFAEIVEAYSKGFRQCNLYLYPKERLYWMKRGLTVIPVGSLSAQSAPHIVSGDFEKIVSPDAVHLATNVALGVPYSSWDYLSK